ncbi:MAG: PAS domain S-box protein, partial [Anaerolineales bacterium]|nr:PAS domain S-box protein [Anaerolineales bacterium]
MKFSTKKKTDLKEFESEEHYRILFQNAPIGIGLADINGNLLVFNDAMTKPGGYTSQDIKALRNVAALYYDPKQRAEALARFQKQGFLNQYPVQFKRKNGTPYDTLLTLTSVLIEGNPCIQAMVEDVTERKWAEQALHVAEEKYRVMVEQIPLIMYTDQIDNLFTSFYISPQVENMLGYLPQEILDDPHLWHRLIFTGDHERTRHAMQQTIESGRAVEEYRMTRRDGTMIWVRDTSVLIRDE